MEHSNPILMGNNSPQKFITIGEVMLRLTPPNYEKIRMASAFEASYGGSEANICLLYTSTRTSSRPGILPARPSSPSLMPPLTAAFSASGISFNFHKIT